MASFHHGVDAEEIFLDDDICGEELLPKTLSTFSFAEQAENNAQSTTDGPKPIHSIQPMVEEPDDCEQDEIESFPSSTSFSMTARQRGISTQITPLIVITDDDEDDIPTLGTLGKNRGTVSGATPLASSRPSAASISNTPTQSKSIPNTPTQPKSLHFSQNLEKSPEKGPNGIPHGDNGNFHRDSDPMALYNVAEDRSKADYSYPDQSTADIVVVRNFASHGDHQDDIQNDQNGAQIDPLVALTVATTAGAGVEMVEMGKNDKNDKNDKNNDKNDKNNEKGDNNGETAAETRTRNEKNDIAIAIKNAKMQQQSQHQSQPFIQTELTEKQRLVYEKYYDYPEGELINVAIDNAISYNSLTHPTHLRVLLHDEQQQLHLYDMNEYGPSEPTLDGVKVSLSNYLTCCPFTLISPRHGLYRWVVLALAWLCLLVVSLIMSSSLYTKVFQLHFDISRSTASWFPALQIALFCLSNLIASRVCDVLGSYLTMAVAFLLTLWGFLIPSLLMNFYSILIIHSFLVGIGAGLLQMSALYTLGDYFTLIPGDPIISSDNITMKDENIQNNDTNDVENNNNISSQQSNQPPQSDKRPLSIAFAVGFALSAFGIGNIAWSPFINHFLDNNIHYKEAFAYSGCVVFAVAIIVLLLMHPRTYPISATKEIIIESFETEMNQLMNVLPLETTEMLQKEPGGWENLIRAVVESAFLRRTFDFTLFFEPSFVLLFIIGLLGACMFYAPFVHLIPHSEDYGLTPNQSSFLLIIIGIVAFFSRIIFSFLVEITHPIISLFIALALQLICATLWYYSDAKSMFQATAVFTGLSAASFIVSLSALPRTIFSTRQSKIIPSLSMLYGLSFAPGAILVGPVMGWVKDEYQSYQRFIAALIVISSITVIACMFFFVLLIIKGSNDSLVQEQRKKEEKEWDEYQAKERRIETAAILIQQSMKKQSQSPQPQLGQIVENDNEEHDDHQQSSQNLINVVRQRNNKGKRVMEREELSVYVQSVLKMRPITINRNQSPYLYYINPYGMKKLSTQYAIALAHWSLGKHEENGWRRLYR